MRIGVTRLLYFTFPFASLREYFEVRFRAKKYGVPYFLAESEAIALRPTERGRRSKGAECGRGFKWRGPTRCVGRRPFKPQTALLLAPEDVRGFGVDLA